MEVLLRSLTLVLLAMHDSDSHIPRNFHVYNSFIMTRKWPQWNTHLLKSRLHDDGTAVFMLRGSYQRVKVNTYPKAAITDSSFIPTLHSTIQTRMEGQRKDDERTTKL